MKKRTINLRRMLSVVTLLSASLAYSQSNNPAPYCSSEFDVNYNMFNNIKINGTQLDFGPMGDWATNTDYTYYNAFTFPELIQGGTTPIELNVYSVNDMEPIYFALWIDFNRNDAFENDELIMQNSNTIMAALPTFGAPETLINKVITIPSTAVTGTTRARLIRATNQADPFAPYDPAFSLAPCNTATMASMGNTYDFNIEITNGNSVGIPSNPAQQNTVSVYPNPAQDFINIQCDEINSINIHIYDVSGKLMKTIEINNQQLNTLNISDLQNGLYYLKGVTEEEVLFSKTLSVIR